MIKRLISGISVAALLLFAIPSTAFSAIITKSFITSITLTVPLSAPANFNPTNGEVLNINVDWDEATYSTYLNSSGGYIRIKQGPSVVKTVSSWDTAGNYPSTTVTWDGKSIDNTTTAKAVCGSVGAACPSGNYQVEVFMQASAGAPPEDIWIDTLTKDFTIDLAGTGGGASSVSINTFNVSPTSGFDPSQLGDNENLEIQYGLSGTADQVVATFKDSSGKIMDILTHTNTSSGTLAWDGEYAGRLIVPGSYTVELAVNKTGEPVVTSSKSFSVAYGSSEKPEISSLGVLPSSFDPDIDDTTISFRNEKDSYISVEVRDASNNKVRAFSGYDNQFYNFSEFHSIIWDGKDTGGTEVGVGTYKVVVIARSNYGVVVKEVNVAVDNSGGSATSTSNNHIQDISFSPSTTFEPAVDDELRIIYDVKTDLDRLQIFAVQGSEKIEITDDIDVAEDTNYEAFWDGTDDNGDFVNDGTWRISFESQDAGTSLTAAKSITVKYAKPIIDELEVSKNKFDNDLGEFTSVMFRIDSDALVDVFLLESGREEDTLVEDMDVQKDQWYAVEWDGDNYDYSDDLDFKVVAKNTVNDKIYDTEIISIDLAEDSVSSSRANITNDYISPVITSGTSGMILSYELEDDADVVITIHKGQSATGTKVIELLDIKDQAAGTHELLWDGKKSTGVKLSDGYYTYKIISKLVSSDTETGVFVVGDVGDLNAGSSTSSSSSSNGNGISPNVVLNGSGSGSFGACGGFSDVSSTSSYCDAISWAASEGIFVGYADGTFKPYQAINRAETVKILMEGLGATILPDDFTNLGFSDVQVGAWYMRYLRTGRFLGAFDGDGGKTTARPGETVNRAELLKITFESAKVMNGFQLGTCANNYIDVSAIAWYYQYACGSKQYGLFDGVSLSPSALSTRGEAAEVLYRLHLAGVI